MHVFYVLPLLFFSSFDGLGIPSPEVWTVGIINQKPKHQSFFSGDAVGRTQLFFPVNTIYVLEYILNWIRTWNCLYDIVLLFKNYLNCCVFVGFVGFVSCQEKNCVFILPSSGQIISIFLVLPIFLFFPHLSMKYCGRKVIFVGSDSKGYVGILI